MSCYPASWLPLKVVMNKEKTRVLFAEANTDFVNVLLSFLALPLGKVVQQLWCNEFRDVLGSLNTLYSCLIHFDGTAFCVRGGNNMLRNPRSSFRAECRKLALDLTDTPPNNKFYVCEVCSSSKFSYMNVSIYSDVALCDCGKSLKRELLFEECLDHGGAFITNPSSFIITDDLSVVPVLSGIIQTLNNLGISDTQGAEVRSMSFYKRDICELLKFSLTSATPLTDMIIKKTGMSSTAARPESDQLLLHHIPKNNMHSRKMVVKAYLQKSTNNFLFAEATGEFVEMLFSFCTIPLGGVEFLFGGKFCLQGIDNLYRSVSNGIDDKCFTTADTKDRLINPKLPHGYVSKNQFLPLSEDGPPKLYYTVSQYGSTSFHEKVGTLVSSFKSIEEYVKKEMMFIVTDDLTVSPSLATSISILNGLEVPLSDVKEMELHVGLEEALRILKASLTSKTALTDALTNPLLNKQPKLELRKPKQEQY